MSLTQRQLPPWPYPLWWAHRGGGDTAPENTLAAFRQGAAFGYRGAECDVKLSADGVPFLLHDDTLDRTTAATGPAAARRWDELSQLDAGRWAGPQWAGERLPSLESVASLLQRQGTLLNLELKPAPGDAVRTGRVVAQAVQRLWAGQAVAPLLSSFEPSALESARQAAPELPRALLLSEFWSGWSEAAQALGVVAVVTHWRLMDANVLDQLHASGWRALVYTVNETAEAERLRKLQGGGVDGIITDALARMRP